MTTTCEKCGHELTIGEHPFCPHGFGIGGPKHDEIPGGLWLENVGPTPVKVYSYAEYHRLISTPQFDKVTGQPYILTPKENFCSLPGTDRDAQGIPNPAGYRSLAAGEILARNGRASVDESTGPDDVPNDPDHVPPEGVHLFNDMVDDIDTVKQFIKDLANAQ